MTDQLIVSLSAVPIPVMGCCLISLNFQNYFHGLNTHPLWNWYQTRTICVCVCVGVVRWVSVQYVFIFTDFLTADIFELSLRNCNMCSSELFTVWMKDGWSMTMDTFMVGLMDKMGCKLRRLNAASSAVWVCCFWLKNLFYIPLWTIFSLFVFLLLLFKTLTFNFCFILSCNFVAIVLWLVILIVEFHRYWQICLSLILGNRKKITERLMFRVFRKVLVGLYQRQITCSLTHEFTFKNHVSKKSEQAWLYKGTPADILHHYWYSLKNTKHEAKITTCLMKSAIYFSVPWKILKRE